MPAPIDDEKLAELRAWARAILGDERAELRAAGRAIAMLADEVERLRRVERTGIAADANAALARRLGSD